eukprot:5083653-Pleurochrysis_carterae.AAC.3
MPHGSTGTADLRLECSSEMKGGEYADKAKEKREKKRRRGMKRGAEGWDKTRRAGRAEVGDFGKGVKD